MKILHVVPGLSEKWNGISVAAKMIAGQQLKSGVEVDLVETQDFIASSFASDLRSFDEIWVHSMWLPITLRACLKVVLSRRRLVRMTHANLDPLRYHYHGWKKKLFAPVEWLLFKFTQRVVVTCEAEKEWCQKWGLKNEFEVLDMKKFFNLKEKGERRKEKGGGLHLLYLGRRHPLKGVEYLEEAVEEIRRKEKGEGRKCGVELQIVSNAFGEEKEKVWEWCDVLVLPTLSENFGLVVAEALEHGKRVITTDGAPAWEPEGSKKEKGKVKKCGRLIYLCGFRDGVEEERVRLLKGTLEGLLA